MLSRVDFIVSSNVEFIGMSSDALRFDVGLTKTDQEGKNNIDHPFHVYSCPENPVICPVLAMAKHLVMVAIADSLKAPISMSTTSAFFGR